MKRVYAKRCLVLGFVVGLVVGLTFGARLGRDDLRAQYRDKAIVTSPAGYHCWRELNNEMRDGTEKICMSNATTTHSSVSAPLGQP